MTEALVGAMYLVDMVRHRWWRRRQIERLARRLGASKRQANRIAHYTP